ncbi:MAG TPA: ABC transporter permease [Candidatus Binatia bacterium]|nr:ABC transporter permease [Candidatus Binatia bacterium]
MIAVFLKDLKLIVRDRWAALFSLLVPIVVITIIAEALFHSEGGPRLLIPVVNDDQGPVANTFIKLLGKHADAVAMSRAEAEHIVRDENRAPAAILFPEGLSKRYLQGKTSELLLLTDPAQAVDLNQVKVLLLLMDKDAAALADPLEEERISLKEQNLTGNRKEVTNFEQNVPGFSIMFVLLAVIFGTSMGLHDERDWGTLPRLLVAPAGFTWMLIGKLAARFVVGVVQMLVLFAWGHWMFRVSLGSSYFAFFLLACAVVFTTVAVGLVVAGIAKTREQTQPLSLAFVMIFSALGGLWWPKSIEPQWMRDISPIAFTSWAMRGMNDLVLRDRGLRAMVVPVTALLVYGLIALLLGLKLFRARHSAR